MAIDPFTNLTYPQPTGNPLAAFTSPGWPFSTGYSDINAVSSRCPTWNPNDPTAFVTPSMVEGWLFEATANIDSALAARGYTVPLEPMTGWAPPPGMPLWNGIGLQAWLMLRSICASYAASYVEQARHGSTREARDEIAEKWMQMFDDFLTRIESGADALVVFGVSGPFPPEPDPTKALTSGALGFFTANPDVQEQPIFTRSLVLGADDVISPVTGSQPRADSPEDYE